MNLGSCSHEIQEMAQQFGFPEEVVHGLYKDAFENLAAEACIKDYLHVLVSKRVRQRLKDMCQIKGGDSSLLAGLSHGAHK